MSTPTLETILKTISIPAQMDLAVALLEAALPAWNAFAENPRNLDYYDGVGGHHEVDAALPSLVVAAVKAEIAAPGTRVPEIEGLYESFRYPIVSIDNSDWEPTPAADRVFCSAFNLTRLYVPAFAHEPKEPKLNLVINQAADALLKAKLRSLEELNAMVRTLMLNFRKSPAGRANGDDAGRGRGHTDDN